MFPGTPWNKHKHTNTVCGWWVLEMQYVWATCVHDLLSARLVLVNRWSRQGPYHPGEEKRKGLNVEVKHHAQRAWRGHMISLSTNQQEICHQLVSICKSKCGFNMHIMLVKWNGFSCAKTATHTLCSYKCSVWVSKKVWQSYRWDVICIDD